LAEAIKSIVDHWAENDLKEVVLVGHSYSGMIITAHARAPSSSQRTAITVIAVTSGYDEHL
jgi:pimeloyl-ACP methyl ester carboxylesterase